MGTSCTRKDACTHTYADRAQVTRDGVDTELRAKGRHDACVVPRAVPMVESMVALVLADQMLQHYAQVWVWVCVCVCLCAPGCLCMHAHSRTPARVCMGFFACMH